MDRAGQLNGDLHHGRLALFALALVLIVDRRHVNIIAGVEAIAALADFGPEADGFRELVDSMVERTM